MRQSKQDENVGLAKAQTPDLKIAAYLNRRSTSFIYFILSGTKGKGSGEGKSAVATPAHCQDF